jgi:hypothetical protein
LFESVDLVQELAEPPVDGVLRDVLLAHVADLPPHIVEE